MQNQHESAVSSWGRQTHKRQPFEGGGRSKDEEGRGQASGTKEKGLQRTQATAEKEAEYGKLSLRDTEEAWGDHHKRRGKANATADTDQVLPHAHSTKVLSRSTAKLYDAYSMTSH